MIRRLSNAVTKQLQPGGLLLWMFAFCAATMLAVFSVLQPQHLYLSVVFSLVFLGIGYRHYMVWRRMRLQQALVLVRSDRESDAFK